MDSIRAYARDEATLSAAKARLSELVRIPSVGAPAEGPFPFGREAARVLEAALSIGQKAGFVTENHDYYCGSVILPGEGEGEVGIICHLDVVPAGSGWIYPPFELTEKDGLLIGRGAEDNKGSVVAALAAMEYLKMSNVKLPFSVRLILGCNEESGMEDLPYFLKVRKAPFFSFTPDSDYPVCHGEKGIAEMELNLGCAGDEILDISGGMASNAVADKAEILLVESCAKRLPEVLPEGISVEKTAAGVFVRAAGKAAHAAKPEGSVNAIGLLASFLTDFEILNQESRQAKAFAYLKKVLADYYGEGLGIAASDEKMGSLTCIGGLIRLQNGCIMQNFNIRYPVSANMQELFEHARKLAEAEGLELTLPRDSKGYYFSPDRPEIAALTRACEEALGKKMQPYVMGGGTYARVFPDTVAFGIGTGEEPTALGPGRGGAHQRDEYIKVDTLALGTEVITRALLELAALKK